MKIYSVRLVRSDKQEQTKEVGALGPRDAIMSAMATLTMRLNRQPLAIYLNGKRVRHFSSPAPRHEPPRSIFYAQNRS